MSEAAVVNDPVLRLVAAALRDAYGERLERAVLFGSRARGDHRDDSDYDIAVFLHAMQSRWDEIKRLVDLRLENLGEMAAYVSLVPFPAGSYRERTPIMHEIRKDGRDL